MRAAHRQGIILSVGLVAVIASLTAFSLGHRAHRTAPPWLPNVVSCRAEPMAHVHDPARLDVRGNCATVSGTVKSVQLVPAYDDLKITLTPDARLMPFLPKANQGVLIADLIATDQASVMIPPVGSRITAWGAWVFDKASRTTQLLPTYHVNVDQTQTATGVLSGHSEEKRGPPPRRSLRLSVSAPRRVEVGGRIDVTIQANWLQDRVLVPASEIRLFVEMTTQDGRGVRWKATMTHTSGLAVLHLVAIQVPATYTLTVYAAPSRQPVSAVTVVDVVRA
ncbi:hypothetical protein [Jatrophihabitans sp.]|uniref:hypothetical protein n=1 Tax=Jatrophihabitans sp. TaxID=1932789 RepID=UPI002B6B058D|nr:hypothetical protein [Jatrophihabitans sp.]